MNINNNQNPIATITVKGYSEPMVIELYYDVAPNTVRNFIYLANKNFYNGSTFHRVIENFMIQGGIGSENACVIAGEFSANGFTNNLKHERGVISMARTTVKNSATSQFFIMHKDSPHLDGSYAGFGKLISGFETLDAIASVDTNRQDRPDIDVVIKSITVDTKGVKYDQPTCYGN
jgi:peptidyl-prolyl cis-trans isomerase B (cyclophilin B)